MWICHGVDWQLSAHSTQKIIIHAKFKNEVASSIWPPQSVLLILKLKADIILG